MKMAGKYMAIRSYRMKLHMKTRMETHVKTRMTDDGRALSESYFQIENYFQSEDE
jgi:hypothetical protein